MPERAATIDAARGSTSAGALFEARGRCGSFLGWIVNNRASDRAHRAGHQAGFSRACVLPRAPSRPKRRDRKSTRLNSSHQIISYAVFCLKKKKKNSKQKFMTYDSS